jgi:hypothetical protein
LLSPVAKKAIIVPHCTAPYQPNPARPPNRPSPTRPDPTQPDPTRPVPPDSDRVVNYRRRRRQSQSSIK